MAGKMGRKEILKFQGKLAIKILKRTLVDKGHCLFLATGLHLFIANFKRFSKKFNHT